MMEDKIKITEYELSKLGFKKDSDSNHVFELDDDEELILTNHGSVNGSEKGYAINFHFEGRRLKYMHEVKELILEPKQLNNEQ